MHRRNLLKSLMTTAIGTGLLAASGNRAWGTEAIKTPAKFISKKPFAGLQDNLMLFYKDWGKGKPVVFIHSWALNSDMWQYQMNDLAAEGLRCIAYDRRGHGRSSQPGDGYDYDTLADDLAMLIDFLDLHDATLVSHSMGAGEIVRYITRHGTQRIHRAVLVSPTTPFLLKTDDNHDGVEKKVFDQLRGALRKDSPHWFASAASGFFGEELPNVSVSPEMIHWGLSLCNQTSLKALLECNRVMIETDFRSEMRKIKIPTLIIHGEADSSTPLALTGEKSAQLIASSEIKIYEGAPHGLFLTHMERLNRDLLAFIKA